MFYNIPIRQKALKNTSEEYNRIVEVVQRYAIHHSSVAFICKKMGSSQSDVHSTKASQLDTIRAIYGNALATELVEFSHSQADYNVNGWISNPNYSLKKREFILFINSTLKILSNIDRLVDCASLRKCLDLVYQKYLPKGSHFFIYLSLLIKAEHVDVNVHPTKKEVHFLREDHIISEIGLHLENSLKTSSQSRSFYVQTTIMPHSKDFGLSTPLKRDSSQSLDTPAPKKTPAQLLVRTDSQSRTLDSFTLMTPLGPTLKRSKSSECGHCSFQIRTTSTPSQSTPIHSASPSQYTHGSNQNDLVTIAKPSFSIISESEILINNPEAAPDTTQDIVALRSDSVNHILDESQPPAIDYVTSSPTPVIFDAKSEIVSIQLTSVLELRNFIYGNENSSITESFKSHKYVGMFNEHLALMQHNTSLLLVNFYEISIDVCYQIVLFGFSNFGSIRLDPVRIVDLVLMGLENYQDWNLEENQSKEAVAESVSQILVDNSAMIREYFSISVSPEGELLCIPNLIPGYIPNLSKLSEFLISLGGTVDWDTEMKCFEGIADCLAKFFAFELEAEIESRNEFSRKVEFLLFPALRQAVGQKRWISDNLIKQVANLQDLYKIFERC